MGKLKYSIVLASVLVASPLATARAADLGPEPMPVPAPVPAAACCNMGGLYLKGFMGITNQESDEITSQYIRNTGEFDIINQGFDSSPLAGIGIGYAYSERFRFDVTGEYRGGSSFSGLDRYDEEPVDGTWDGTNEYRAIKKEWLMLANAYWDIATFHGITPYVGGGLGWANISIDNFSDVNNVTNGVSYANDNSSNNFAWALHAGLAYDVTDNLKFDVGYRYVNLGDAKSGTITEFNSGTTYSKLEFNDIESHDVMVGLRWQWGDSGCCEPAYVETSYPTTYK